MYSTIVRLPQCICWLMIALCAVATPASAQGGGTLVTTARVNLRPTASSDRPAKAVLPAGTRLVQADPKHLHGYVAVTLADDPSTSGWVSARYVTKLAPEHAETFVAPLSPPDAAAANAPADAISPAWAKPPIMHAPFDGTTTKGVAFSCGFSGDTNSVDLENNERKDRSDVPTQYHAVKFAAIADALLWPKGTTRVAWDKTDKGRQDRASLVTPFEGVAVTVTGFIRVLRPEGKESTNCGQAGVKNTDMHIALVDTFNALENRAMVVELAPRGKRLHEQTWTRARLGAYENPVQRTDSVRFSGFLMLDPDHPGHLGVHRRTLWEIHPVTRIEMFVDGKWKDLDDIP